MEALRICVFRPLRLQQIGIGRVLADPAPHERALRDHLQAGGPHLVERPLDQFRADAFTAEFRGHLGMNEGDDTAVELVIAAIWPSTVNSKRCCGLLLETTSFMPSNSSAVARGSADLALTQ